MKNYTIKTLAEDIKSAVEWLRAQECGCVTLKLDDRLAVCVGWSEGFDPDDETVIHSKENSIYALCAEIKVWTSDDLRTDLDWIDAPYYEDDSVYETEIQIVPDEDYLWLAKYFLNEFDTLKELDIDEKGLIREHCYLVFASGSDDRGCSVEFERNLGWFDTYEEAHECFVKSQYLDWSSDFNANKNLFEIEISIDEYVKNGEEKSYFDTPEETVIYR